MGGGLGGGFLLLTLTAVFLSLSSPTSAQTCKSHTFSSNRVFSACNDLPLLSSYLYWTYDSSSAKLQLAYRHTGVSSSTWVAWAINPTSTGMVGSQALIAYQRSNGSIRAYTAPVTGYQTSLPEGSLSFDVSHLSAEYSNSEMVIYATLGLANLSSKRTLKQVWQDGPVSGDAPRVHATSGANVQSMGTVDLLSGAVGSTGGGGRSLKKKNIHGVLNAVSWGILMPIGAIIARYLKVFKSANPAWFHIHVSCQTMAYVVGVAGWGTGLKLGSDSPGVTYSAHRTIGIIMFSLATLQVFALLLRPKPDHKLRLFWNIYHHTIGYSIIVLGVINIFKGLDILDPAKKWRNAYIGVIAALAFCAVWLEAYTWFVVVKRKRSDQFKMPQGINGSNGHSHNHNGV